MEALKEFTDLLTAVRAIENIPSRDLASLVPYCQCPPCRYERHHPQLSKIPLVTWLCGGCRGCYRCLREDDHPDALQVFFAYRARERAQEQEQEKED